MSRTRVLLVLSLVIGAGLPAAAEEQAAPLVADICEADLRRHLELLASDAMKGRESLSEEALEASDYIAETMASFGVEPLGTDGTWFQPYAIRLPILKDGNVLEVSSADGRESFAVEKDWNPFSVTAEGDVTAGVVFAGYGIEAPGRNWDDYAGVDVKGKVVLVLRKNPGWREQRHASFLRKIEVAAKQGAAALLLVNDPETTKRAGADRIGHWAAPLGRPGGSAPIPYAFVSQAVAASILKPLGTTLEHLETALKKDGPQSAAIEGVSVRVATALTVTTDANTRNVVGYLPGRDPELALEFVVLGAHYDHVGLGTYGTLGGRAAAGQIHNGADDNGSGSVTLLELAHWFSRPENRPRRSLVFVAFSGEERGLLGSQHYVDHPTVPLVDIVAMVNMDMVGRSKDGQIQIGGVGTAKGLQALVARHNQAHRLRIEWDPQGVAPSDNTSFFRKGIPVLFFFTGLHKDYHRPSDTVDKVNFDDMVRIGNLVKDVTRDIGDLEDALEFTTPPPPPSPPWLGIMPSAEPDHRGLAIARVTPDGPAMKAGMQDADVIVEMGGQAIRNLQGLRQVLGRLKAGKAVKVVVIRDEERVPLSVVLGERPRRNR